MSRKKAFLMGIKDGLPIGLGYFAVSFSLGIMAGKGGLNAIMGFIASLFTRASAGEYGVYSLIAVDATYLEIVIISLITNLRYLLMSTALSQKIDSKTGLVKRALIGCCVTDEIFGISIAYKGTLEPLYTFGAFAISSPMWALGTALGITAGNILPSRAVSALSVALYGMFLAIIIPPSKKDKAVLISVIIAFLFSYLSSIIPGIKTLSSGTRTIILTIGIAALAAVIHPIKPETPPTSPDCAKQNGD